MICEKCKKRDATVFYEQTVNGKSRSYSLCGECAKEMKQNGELMIDTDWNGGFFGASPFGALSDNFFSGFFGLPETVRTSKKLCPLCHASCENFRTSGKAGCPSCYETFAAELEATLRSIHGNTKHVGKAPAKHKKKQDGKNQLEALREQLAQAIKQEDFENAARLRDEIRKLEAEA